MPLSVSVTQIHTHTSLELQFDTYISNCNPPPQDSFYTSSFQLLTYFPHSSGSDQSVTLFYTSLNVSLCPLLLSLMPCAAGCPVITCSLALSLLSLQCPFLCGSLFIPITSDILSWASVIVSVLPSQYCKADSLPIEPPQWFSG